jgi:aerobic-type carbon monoxide dehydrogenase small subunit (CoxS/CutS family)
MKVTELHVNGAGVRLSADPVRSLLSVLRDDLQLTGAKYGCGEAQCGACTVLVDGAPVRSCVTPINSIGARKVTTIEGLEQNGKLHPVQEAFLEEGAFQCGYCTCGMVLSAVAFLRRNPGPSRSEIVRGLNGNICRCGTYSRIITAVSKAADRMNKQ